RTGHVRPRRRVVARPTSSVAVRVTLCSERSPCALSCSVLVRLVHAPPSCCLRLPRGRGHGGPPLSTSHSRRWQAPRHWGSLPICASGHFWTLLFWPARPRLPPPGPRPHAPAGG